MNSASTWTTTRFAGFALAIVLALPGAFHGADFRWQPQISRANASSTFEVLLNHPVSSETARVGDVWSGMLVHDVTIDDLAIPAGSRVNGVVSGVSRGASRAALVLAARTVNVFGINQAIAANTEALIAVPPGVAENSGGDRVELKDNAVVRFTLDEAVSMK